MKRHLVLTWLLALLVTGLPVQAQNPLAASEGVGAVFIVNSAGDAGDPDTGDGICDTTGKRSPPTEYSGLCTLRAAILTANPLPPRIPSPSAVP